MTAPAPGPRAAFLRAARLLTLPLVLPLAALPPAGTALAATPDWGRRPYGYVSVEQDLREVLKDFASNLGLTLQASEAVQGVVRGRLPASPPREFLDQLTRTYGLLWYWDGFILWVYTLEEAESRIVKLQTAGTVQLTGALEELDISDGRFPIRTSQASSILHVTGPPRYVELVVATAEMLEANRNVAIDMRVFPLRYANADDRVFNVRDREVIVPGVATILGRLAAGGGIRLPAGTSRERVSTFTGSQGPAGVEFYNSGGGGGGGPQQLFQPAGGGAPPEGPTSTSLPRPGDDEVRIQADPRLNAVIVRDLADRMPVYARLIESLDREQPLIELEVVIADVSSDRLVDLGVDWRLGTGGDDGASVGVGDADLALGALRQGITFAAAVTTDPLTVLARIRALESRGEARVVSRPAVLTFDNVEALLDQSESFFVRLEGERAVQLQEIVVGLLVKVTPRLIDDGTGRPRVQMTIDIEDGTALPEEAVDQIPSVQRANLSTQGLVAERQALVIGGFYRERQLDNLDKVPILGDIPVLGWALFQRRNKQQTSITRLFMIRPIVVRDVERRGVVSGSLTRDGPPAPLFRQDARLGRLTPDAAVTMDEIRFGTLLGDRVLGRAEGALCLGRAVLDNDCKAGPAPRLDADPFARLEAREEGPPAGPAAPLPPPPALY